MRNLINKISSLFTEILIKIGFTKRKSHSDLDAIGFPHHAKNQLVEDFEMAAYHNQA
jgi:hypothetical protein